MITSQILRFFLGSADYDSLSDEEEESDDSDDDELYDYSSSSFCLGVFETFSTPFSSASSSFFNGTFFFSSSSSGFS